MTIDIVDVIALAGDETLVFLAHTRAPIPVADMGDLLRIDLNAAVGIRASAVAFHSS